MVEGLQTIIDTVRSKSNRETSDKSKKERAKRRQTKRNREDIAVEDFTICIASLSCNWRFSMRNRYTIESLNKS